MLEIYEIRQFAVQKSRCPSTSVDGRDFDGRHIEKPSSCRPVKKVPETLTERVGYPSYGTRRTGATGTACSPKLALSSPVLSKLNSGSIFFILSAFVLRCPRDRRHAKSQPPSLELRLKITSALMTRLCADVDMDLTLVASAGEEEDEQQSDGEGQHEKQEDENSDPQEEDSQEEEDSREEEESQEEDDDDDDDDDELVIVPTKRKRTGSGKKSTTKAPPTREIEYQVAIYTAQQMKKKKSACGHPITEIVTLDSTKPWAVLKTHILTKIDTALNPRLLHFSEYSITFTVPRKVKDPIHLTDAAKYDYLVKNALLIQKIPSAKIVVEPKAESVAREKENDTNGDEDDATKTAKKGEKKTKLKGKPLANVETSPNNSLFDTVAVGARAAQLPLLQRRLELRDQAAAKNAPAVPQVNINLPPEFANLLRPVVPPAAPAPAAPNAFIPPPNTANMLIPYPHIPGADLLIQDFCSLYDLDNDICEKFQIPKYKRTNAFKFVEVDELKEMGFMKGEIAELKVAVGKWSQLPRVGNRSCKLFQWFIAN
ncbi:hypothetical protein B0H13DRAFT_2330240 [Mycena leptocephala]|nr:hypothetical protein B0H13DRAFT_2330240 [Mycena leptocephala]